jgi:Sigma-70, region 4
MPAAATDRTRDVDYFSYALRLHLEKEDARELLHDNDTYRDRAPAVKDSKKKSTKTRTADPSASSQRSTLRSQPESEPPKVMLRTSFGVRWFTTAAVFCFVALSCLAGIKSAMRRMAAPHHVKAAISDDAPGIASATAASVVKHFETTASPEGTWCVSDTESLYKYSVAAGRNGAIKVRNSHMRMLTSRRPLEDGFDQTDGRSLQPSDVLVLQDSIRELAPDDTAAEVLKLRMMGCTYEEISGALDISERTVRSRASEIRQRFFQGQPGDEADILEVGRRWRGKTSCNSVGLHATLTLAA